ncbi:hypothetical protein OH687_26570 [Burkholderia anthina]|nr:hypothetical protein OH687_26570 [Burkholderia anthina]
MPDRRNQCFARNVPCSLPSISPCFCAAPGTPAPRFAPQRCIADAARTRGAPPTRMADAAPHPTNIVLPRVTDVQSALHQKRRGGHRPERAGRHAHGAAGPGEAPSGRAGQSDAMNCPVNSVRPLNAM